MVLYDQIQHKLSDLLFTHVFDQVMDPVQILPTPPVQAISKIKRLGLGLIDGQLAPWSISHYFNRITDHAGRGR